MIKAKALISSPLRSLAGDLHRDGALAGVAERVQHAAGVVAAAHGHAAGAGYLQYLVSALGKHLDEAFDLAGRAGELEHGGFRGDIDDAGLEYLGEVEEVGALLVSRWLGAGGDLDERELADDGGVALDLVHIARDLELVERGLDAGGGVLRRLGDDGHARDVVALAMAHGERDDVDVETAEERSDAGEHAGLVFNECNECVQHLGFPRISFLYKKLNGDDGDKG